MHAALLAKYFHLQFEEEKRGVVPVLLRLDTMEEI
jgi:hypothetical protein